MARNHGLNRYKFVNLLGNYPTLIGKLACPSTTLVAGSYMYVLGCSLQASVLQNPMHPPAAIDFRRDFYYQPSSEVKPVTSVRAIPSINRCSHADIFGFIDHYEQKDIIGYLPRSCVVAIWRFLLGQLAFQFSALQQFSSIDDIIDMRLKKRQQHRHCRHIKIITNASV